MKTKELKKVQTGLPLPEPIELAKLAAILRPGSEPKAALITAMQFYVEAACFWQESASKTLKELIAEFGSDNRWLKLAAEPIKKIRQAQWADTLELDRTKNTDPAREFLAKRGVSLKTERAVLANIRDSWNARPKNTLTAGFRESADAIIVRCKALSNGKTIYNIPRFLLEDAADYVERRRRDSKLKWARKSRKAAVKKSGKENFRKSSV